MDLLDHQRNVYSQNGEDGVIEAILGVIDAETQWCCEFGAWDGIHFSNTRRLIEGGWSAVLIEANETRYEELVANSGGYPNVHTFQAVVGVHERLESLLDRTAAPELDLLVVDVDGLDYEIVGGLEVRPRVLCVEVNAGHSPRATESVPREVAKHNVGQPLTVFQATAERLGYRLVGYTGNAFYVRSDVPGLPVLTPEEAYRSFLVHLDQPGRRWLYHVNRGEVPPFHAFHNPYLTREALDLPSTYLGAGIRARHWLKRSTTRASVANPFAKPS